MQARPGLFQVCGFQVCARGGSSSVESSRTPGPVVLERGKKILGLGTGAESIDFKATIITI